MMNRRGFFKRALGAVALAVGSKYLDLAPVAVKKSPKPLPYSVSMWSIDHHRKVLSSALAADLDHQIMFGKPLPPDEVDQLIREKRAELAKEGHPA